jgi:hypothetical protein
MSHHEDGSHEPGHAHPPPGLPDVKDEAGDTPPWVPKLGILLGLLLAGLIAFSIVRSEQAATHDAPAADAETEAAEKAPEAAE